MRITLKLTGLLALVVLLVVGTEAWFRVQREVAIYRADTERDHALLGQATNAALLHVWKHSGKAEALALLADADATDPRVQIRWVPDAAAPASAGSGLSKPAVRHRQSSPRTLTTSIPTIVDGRRLGWLELTEDLDAQQRYLDTAIRSVTTIGLATALGWIAVTWIVGNLLIGRRAHDLVAYARGIGEGDFEPRSPLSARDELGELSQELDRMALKIGKAQSRLKMETERRVAMADQLRHADRLTTVGRLAAGVAHEMGTPLNVIDARAEMIVEGETDEPAACARVVREQVQRITRIVRQLLDFARKPPTHREPCDFGAAARTVADLLSTLARKHQVTIEVKAPPKGPTSLVAAGQVEQVLTNIVVNAVQASPAGGRVEVEVWRALATSPAPGGGECDCVVMRVSDQGPGIPPEAEPHLFDPFFTTKDVGLGTGLGLSVSYGIVDEHGGWIEASTRAVGGAAFTIYVPCKEETLVPTS